ERVRELTQASIECGEPRFEVVEASGGDSADFPLDVWNDSTPRVANVVRERGEILERAVVQVEAEPQEPLLRRVDEQALARVRSLEQHVALDDGGDGRGGFGEVAVDGGAVVDAPARDDGAPRHAPAVDRHADDRLPSLRFAGSALD